MNQQEIDERIRYGKQRAAQYGFRQISAAVVYGLFDMIVAPTTPGFAILKPGLYGKHVTSEIFHLIKFQAYKGATYMIRWGVSLTYMPHAWLPKPKWHRTMASAQFDLFEEPVDYLVSDDAPWREREQFYAATTYGEACLRDDLTRAWQRVRPALVDWFATAQSPQEIAHKAEAQLQRRWSGHHHYPPPALVAAFSYARAGESDRALDWLQRAMPFLNDDPNSYARLRELLTPTALRRTRSGLFAF